METFEFKFYKSYTETFDNLTDEQSGKLLKRMYKFYFEQIDEKSDLITEALFSQIKYIMLKSLKGKECGEKYGHLGGNPNLKNKRGLTPNKLSPQLDSQLDSQHKDKDKDKDIIINNNIKENIKENKNKYGEYKNILLSQKEVQNLIQDYGKEIFTKYIKILDEGIQMKGYKYKDHNLAIRNWIRRDNEKNNKGKLTYEKEGEKDYLKGLFTN